MNRSFKTARQLHRFLKGQSGNPEGRPKGSKNLATLFKERRDEKVKVVEEGRELWITGGELVIRGMYERAMKGDLDAIEMWMTLKKEIDRARADRQQAGYLLIPEDETMEEWRKRYGITTTSDDEHLNNTPDGVP